MSIVSKIDSNFTGLRIAECQSDGSLPVTPVWYPAEPNSYNDFGGQLSTLARNPINDSRQRKKGVIVDLDASGGFQTDLTYEAVQLLAPGLMFANYRTKAELAVATVTSSQYSPASGGTGYVANDLLLAKGFADAANNGLKVVSGSPGAAAVPSSTGGLVAATTQSGTISKVGHSFASGDITTTLNHLLSTVFDFTTIGLIPGEWIYVGGDAAGDRFATAGCNGWMRVLSVTAHDITLDKTAGTMATDAGTGKTIRIFFGRVLKNELGTAIVRHYYELERQLGAPETGSPSSKQAEYLTKAIVNECTLQFNTADKVTLDWTFVAADHEQNTYTEGLKTGTRPTLVEGSAFNTTSHVKRMKLSLIDTINTPLFAYLTDGSLAINNNVQPNKAISVLGAFDQTAGTFEVSATLTAYFSTVDAVAAVRQNSNVSLDFVLATDNEAIVIDMPLVTLGDGRLNVEQDNPVTLPLSIDAATASTIDENRDYTLMWVFFDYVPTVAL